jgi:hypothetical protein
MKKLRVGFLIDDLQPNQYVIDLIDFVANNKYFDAPVLITGYKLKNSKTFTQKLIDIFKKNPIQFVNNIFRIIFLRVIRIIEIKIVLKRFPKYKTNDEETILKSYEIIKIDGTWSKSDLFLKFTDKDLSLTSNHNLDCIIRCGSGILKGEVLNLTEFGVISFHHGDNRINRGGPSGFWEVFKGEPSSGFIIQKLNQELDGGQVLYRGNVMTTDLWLANNAQLLEKSNVFLMRLLLDLAINRVLPKPESIRLYGNKVYKLASTTVLFKYLLIIIIPKIFERIVSRLLSPKIKRWSVAYAYHNEHIKSLWQYMEVKNPKGRYLADPFVFYHNESNYIFVEDLLCKDNKGRISAIKIDEGKYEFLDVVLEEDFHLSFPFIFRDNDEIYMIPESCKNFDIRLYKCLEFPKKWKLEQVLMSNVSAADTILIKQQDTWFMLTNICSAEIGDHNSELHVFYSEDLKSNLWKPIASGNPVIFDSLKARNGGLFFHNETIYRVNQVHGKTNYGKSFNINEVVKISKNEYVEKKISSIDANFKDKIISTHHYSANASLAAVDFARYQRLKKVYKK